LQPTGQPFASVSAGIVSQLEYREAQPLTKHKDAFRTTNAEVSIDLRRGLWRTQRLRKRPCAQYCASKKKGGLEMVKRLFLVVVFVLAVLTGYAIGQSDVKPLPGGPVFSGGDFGFQADEPLPDIMKNGRSSITGKFVVNVNGRWVEARLRSGIVPVR
jgi:hypothetical protein